MKASLYPQLPCHTHRHHHFYIPLLIFSYIHMCIRLCVDVCVERVSWYGLGECRGMLRFEYAGKIGYTTISPDQPKSQPLHNFILYLLLDF